MSDRFCEMLVFCFEIRSFLAQFYGDVKARFRPPPRAERRMPKKSSEDQDGNQQGKSRRFRDGADRSHRNVIKPQKSRIVAKTKLQVSGAAGGEIKTYRV
jgi:hypothetical protein